MIKLNGSYLEGGGALVRVALALSTLTDKPFSVKDVRSGRPQPGLKAQHLTAIKALKEISAAKTSDVELGTTEFWFHPGKIKGGKYTFDIGTAGSITLFLQALLLPCLFAPSKITLTIKGGTCGKWQASVDYLQNILLPQLKRFVSKIDLKIIKRGYYPKGGGEICLEITPKIKLKDYDSFNSFNEELQFKIEKINLFKQGTLEQIKGIINVSNVLVEKEVAERIKKSAENKLKDYDVPVNIRTDYAQSLSVGGELLLWAIFSEKGSLNFTNPVLLGSSTLVEKGKSSEQIGKEAADQLIKEIDSKAAVDEHLADQLICFMSLLPGSEIFAREISNHTKTNIYVTEQFLDVGFRVSDNKITVLEKDL